jgi:DNA-binding response OmpR family regulator
MRILLVSSPEAETETAYVHKAFREIAHSVQAADGLSYALSLALHEEFDTIVISVVGATQMAALCSTFPELGRLPRTPLLIVTLASDLKKRVRLNQTGVGPGSRYPCTVLRGAQERMLALHRASVACSATSSIDTASLRLDALTRDLVEDGKRVLMTKREYLLIECLLRQANAPVARDQLIRYAWPDKENVDSSSVNLVVLRLGRKLETNGIGASVETVSRYGYQFATR